MTDSQEFETSNIHSRWLENIYEQIRDLQSMNRLANEGCSDIMDYLQVPYDMRGIIIPDTQYKNLRMFILELNLLISNVAKPLGDTKVGEYKEKMEKIIDNIDNRKLFLEEIKQNGQVVSIVLTPLFNSTVTYLSSLYSELIKDVSHLLYIPEQEQGKKW